MLLAAVRSGVSKYHPSITYYVDPAGSDAAAGTSAGTAWQTLSKVNGTTLTAGQTVALKAGGVWRETLTPGQSGIAGAPITYTSYGTGAQPIISAANTATWTQGTGQSAQETGGVFASGMRRISRWYNPRRSPRTARIRLESVRELPPAIEATLVIRSPRRSIPNTISVSISIIRPVLWEQTSRLSSLVCRIVPRYSRTLIRMPAASSRRRLSLMRVILRLTRQALLRCRRIRGII